MRFNMFRRYEGYSISGYGSQIDLYSYDRYENGKLIFYRQNGLYILFITIDEFINGLDETYLNAFHRYELSMNNKWTKEEIIDHLRSLKQNAS